MFGSHARHEERIKQTGLEEFIPMAVSALGAAGSVATAVGALSNNKRSPAPPPPIAPPALMPTPDDQAAKLAKRRSIANQVSRSGRESTFLTPDPGGLLGA